MRITNRRVCAPQLYLFRENLLINQTLAEEGINSIKRLTKKVLNQTILSLAKTAANPFLVDWKFS